MRLARMRNPQTHHAHGHLRHLIGMRVVHEGARATGREFVHIGLASRNLLLVEAADPIHAVGQALAMPVDRGVLGQAVGHEDPHPIAFHHLKGWARALPVVAPHIDVKAGRHFSHHRLGHQVELLDAIFHAKGQAPAVERNHRSVRPTCTRDTWRQPGCGGIGTAAHHRLGQSGQRWPADRRDRCTGHRHAKKISAFHGQCPAEERVGPKAAEAAMPPL